MKGRIQSGPRQASLSVALRGHFCYEVSMRQNITSDPRIMFGKPVIAGTRITVEHILRCLAVGSSPDEIVANYPPLSLADIRNAQAFAADHLARESVFAAE